MCAIVEHIVKRIIHGVECEVEGKKERRAEIASLCREVPLKIRKNIRKGIMQAIYNLVIHTQKTPVETYNMWKERRKVLEQILAPINICTGRDRKTDKLPIKRSIMSAIIDISQNKKEEISAEIYKELHASFRGNMESSIETPYLLQCKIGERKKAEEIIIREYVENAKKESKAKKENVEEQIKILFELPGITLFAHGVQYGLVRKIQKSVIPIVLEDKCTVEESMHALLVSKRVDILSKVIEIDVPREEKQKLLSLLRRAIRLYIAEEPFRKTIEIKEMAWTKKGFSVISCLSSNELASFVKDNTEKYIDIFIANVKQIVFEKTRAKVKMQALKTITTEIANTFYFEESLVSLAVCCALQGVSIKRMHKIFMAFEKKWRFQTTRRLEEIFRNFSQPKKLKKNVYLTYANSFCWPSNMPRLDIPNITWIDHIKREVERKMKKERVNVEWIDTFSAIEVEIMDVSVMLSFIQYYLIIFAQSEKEIDLPFLEKNCSNLLLHTTPLLAKQILIQKDTPPYFVVGSGFFIADSWANLFPEYAIAEREKSEYPSKKLTTLFLDSYIIRKTKQKSPQDKNALIEDIFTNYGISSAAVELRISALTEKGFIEDKNRQLAYLP